MHETIVKMFIVKEAEILLKVATQFIDAHSSLGRTAYGCHTYGEAWVIAGGYCIHYTVYSIPQKYM